LELEPAHCYSPNPAGPPGPPGQLLQHACVTPGHKADRRCHRSPTSPPRFSTACLSTGAHGVMPPTVAVPTVCPHPQSRPTYTPCLTLTTPLVSSVPIVSYRAAHHFPAGSHRLARPHEHPHHLTLSFACLGFEAKVDFFISPLPSSLHHSHYAPTLLSAAACCCIKPSEQLAVRHPIPGLTQCHHEGHLQSRCLLPCFPVGAPSSPGILDQPQSRPASHRASLSPRNAPRPHQLHPRPPANLPHRRAPSAKVHRRG
jgi:hypothetical protein